MYFLHFKVLLSQLFFMWNKIMEESRSGKKNVKVNLKICFKNEQQKTVLQSGRNGSRPTK